MSMFRKFALGIFCQSLLALGEETESEKMVILTDDNFRQEIDGADKKPMFVKFYAPWCGHCKRMAPDWTSLANEASNESVSIAKCDLTVHNGVAEQMKIRGFPTLKLFADGVAYDYQGPRTLADMKEFALGGWKGSTKSALPWNETILDKAGQFANEYLTKVKQVSNYEPSLLPSVYLLGVLTVLLFRIVFQGKTAPPPPPVKAEKKD